MERETSLEAFVKAGMISQEAVETLTFEQRTAIESWDAETVQLLISLYRQTGPIRNGIFWI